MKRDIFTIGVGHENTVVALSNEINKVLEEFFDSEVIDIKYTSDNDRHSALILFKNNKDVHLESIKNTINENKKRIQGKINESRGH